jgi:hypothetical protein
VIIACRPSATPTPRDQSYFPLELGEQWTYDTVFNGPTQRTATTVVAVCRVREADNVGTMFLVSTCADDQLVEASLVYRHGPEVAEPILVNRDGEARPRDPPEVIARSDLRVGQAWRWEGKAGEDERTSVYMVTNQGTVFTPAGELHGVRVVVSNPSTSASTASVERWFAPGIGLVKEAGALTFPVEGGQLGQIELVRTLRQHGIVPVDSIPCCTQVPAGAGA